VLGDVFYFPVNQVTSIQSHAAITQNASVVPKRLVVSHSRNRYRSERMSRTWNTGSLLEAGFSSWPVFYDDFTLSAR
jgi:hypothetical protein